VVPTTTPAAEVALPLAKSMMSGKLRFDIEDLYFISRFLIKIPTDVYLCLSAHC
jgi:hypothetical protein